MKYCAPESPRGAKLVLPKPTAPGLPDGEEELPPLENPALPPDEKPAPPAEPNPPAPPAEPNPPAPPAPDELPTVSSPCPTVTPVLANSCKA